MYLPSDFWNHLPSWLIWIVLGVMLLGFLGARLSEAYPWVAKLIPVLGGMWRRRAQREEQKIEDRAKELAEEISGGMKPPDFDRRIVELEHRLQLLEFSEEVNQAYLIEDAKWHWSADITIAEAALAVKFLPRVPYSEFARKYREGWRPTD